MNTEPFLPSDWQLLDASTDMVDRQEGLGHKWVVQGEGAGDNLRFAIGRQGHRMPFGQPSGKVLDGQGRAFLNL